MIEPERKDVESWIEYKRLVIKSLEDLQNGLADVQRDLQVLKTQQTVIKTQAAMIAAIIGFVFTIISGVIIEIITHHLPTK